MDNCGGSSDIRRCRSCCCCSCVVAVAVVVFSSKLRLLSRSRCQLLVVLLSFVLVLSPGVVMAVLAGLRLKSLSSTIRTKFESLSDVSSNTHPCTKPSLSFLALVSVRP